jgi:hypothetical protein
MFTSATERRPRAKDSRQDLPCFRQIAADFPTRSKQHGEWDADFVHWRTVGFVMRAREKRGPRAVRVWSIDIRGCLPQWKSYYYQEDGVKLIRLFNIRRQMKIEGRSDLESCNALSIFGSILRFQRFIS